MLHSADVPSPESEPLEDDFCDVLQKAMAGHAFTPETLARSHAPWSPRDVQAWASGKDLASADDTRILAERLSLELPALEAMRTKAYHPQVPLPASVRRYRQLPQPSYGYLIRSADDAAIVDPAGDPHAATTILAEWGCALRYILITHHHADHCDALAYWHAQFPHAQVLINPVEYASAGLNLPDIRPTSEGVDLPFGNLRLKNSNVPGHTDQLTAYRIGDIAFIGDMLFAGSIGRRFSTTTSFEQQLRNTDAFLHTLAPTTTLLPGHGPPTTPEREFQHNAFFAASAS